MDIKFLWKMLMDVFSALTAVAVALISFVSFGQMEVD